MDKKAQTIATYDQSALEMAKKFDEMKPRIEDIQRFFELMENKNNPKVLEIGFGSGRDVQEILKFTKNYIGIDVSKSLLKIAKTNLPEAVFQLADLENYQFSQDLDGIIAFASLLHSNRENVRKVFVQAEQKLVNNGVFYVSLKKGEYHQEGDTKEDQFGIRTYYFYNPEMLEELAGGSFKKIYLDEQHLNGQDWFTIVFRKIN